MKLKKKLLAIFTSLALVVGTFSPAVFAAAPDFSKMENGVAALNLENPYCQILKDVDALDLKFTKGDLSFQLPVERVEEEDGLCYLYFGAAKIKNQLMAQLEALKLDVGDIHNADDLYVLLEGLYEITSGFDVELVGAEHDAVDGHAFIMSGEFFRKVKEIIEADLAASDSAYTTLEEMIKGIFEDMELDWKELVAEGFLTEEEAAELQVFIENIDEAVAYLTSSEFTGILVAGATVDCDCPYIYDYVIQHRYYEKDADGNLHRVGVVSEGTYDEWMEEYYLQGEEGTEIAARDYIKPTYKDKQYTFLGSYDSMVLYEDDFQWSDYELREFTLGNEDGIDGLILRYVLDESVKQTGKKNTDAFTSPATGDETPIGVYVILLVVAVGAAGGIAFYHRKKK